MKRKKTRKLKPAVNHDDIRQYHYEAEDRLGTIRFSSLEEEAQFLKRNRSYGGETIEQRLKNIVEEIYIRFKKTAKEIFEIGAAIYDAQDLCKTVGIGFQKWLKENFGSSYEHVNNCKNVYINCMGYMELALNVPISLLYKLGSDSFPEELRKHLFLSGGLQNMKGKKFDDIHKKFKKSGFEAVKDDLEHITHQKWILNQVGYYRDQILSLERMCFEFANNAEQEYEIKEFDREAQNILDTFIFAAIQSWSLMDEALFFANETSASDDGKIANL